METRSSRLGVGRGADNPTPEIINRKPKMWPRNSQIDFNRNDWEKSIKEAKVRIGL
jgi:hypothetical protein